MFRQYFGAPAGQVVMRLILTCLVLLSMTACHRSDAQPTGSAPSQMAPAFTHTSAADWLNSPPLTLERLRGQVVLVEFWTYGCSNCRNTLPWLKAVHARYQDQGLAVVSVHTPEFDRERDHAKIADAVRSLGVKYPVMIDNDSSYWQAMNNRYWPAFYLIDQNGKVVASAFGELHAGTARGDRFEDQIKALLH